MAVQAVERAISLLNEVGRRGEWVGVRELARAVGLKVPTAQNLLKTLAACGYLEFDPESRQYRVGLAALHLAASLDPTTRTGEFAHPYLRALSEELGETLSAGILQRGQVILVDIVHARHPLAVVHSSRVADHPHLMATGQLLFGLADEETQRRYAAGEPLADMGPNTAHTVPELLDDFRKARERGYGEVIDPGGNGVAAVAVPVWGADGRVAMAIACSGPVSRFDRQRMEHARRRLGESAAEMGTLLGLRNA